jgi:hypothetical protein
MEARIGARGCLPFSWHIKAASRQDESSLFISSALSPDPPFTLRNETRQCVSRKGLAGATVIDNVPIPSDALATGNLVHDSILYLRLIQNSITIRLHAESVNKIFSEPAVSITVRKVINCHLSKGVRPLLGYGNKLVGLQNDSYRIQTEKRGQYEKAGTRRCRQTHKLTPSPSNVGRFSHQATPVSSLCHALDHAEDQKEHRSPPHRNYHSELGKHSPCSVEQIDLASPLRCSPRGRNAHCRLFHARLGVTAWMFQAQ